MNTSVFRQIKLLLALIVVFIITTSVALAASGTWSKAGFTMTGSVGNSEWPAILDQRARAQSSAQGPGPMQQISVLIQMKDRCLSPNGTWLAWNQYAIKSGSASWSYSTGYIYAQGTYQNCFYGHQYRNESTHTFFHSAASINMSKLLADQW